MEPATHNPFSILVKPIGPACNQSCSYCFYREKTALFPGNACLSDWILKEDLLEELVCQYLESQDSPAVQFVWQGGEPTLLGIDYFRKIIALQRKYSNGKQVDNALQTNGTLIDDHWSEFLAENRFLVGISVDGPESLHNHYRVDGNGRPSFDKVLKGIECLKKRDVEFNTLTSVQKDNARFPLEVYRFLKEIGQGFMQFIPVVERISNNPDPGNLTLASPHAATPARLSDWSVEPLQYGKFLCAIFDEWVRSDVGNVFIQLFDETLAAWVGMEPGLCAFRRTCGTAVVIEHNGDCYACDHYVYPENRIGNIRDMNLASMVNSLEQQRFGRNKLDSLPEQCRTCEVLFACNGECPKHRFVDNGNGEPGLNYLCPGYKLFFTHTATAMEFMAAELRARRPPANIMEWMRNRDQSASGDTRTGEIDT